MIIQNNAGSTVGQAVMQLAAARGIKTINIMRLRCVCILALATTLSHPPTSPTYAT